MQEQLMQAVCESPLSLVDWSALADWLEDQGEHRNSARKMADHLRAGKRLVVNEYDTKQIKKGTGCKNRRDVLVSAATQVELYGDYWDGGSRETWFTYDMTSGAVWPIRGQGWNGPRVVREMIRGVAIVQGGTDRGERDRCAAPLLALDFPGYAIGGLSVGEDREAMLQTLEHTAALLPDARPRYFMGIGKPRDLLDAIARGVDLFDCVIGTRNGRNASLFTPEGVLHLRNRQYLRDDRPVDPRCPCPCCRDFSRAYLHHLVKAGEILGAMLLTWHNLHYYQALMAEARAAIEEGRFADLAARVAAIPTAADPPHAP